MHLKLIHNLEIFLLHYDHEPFSWNTALLMNNTCIPPIPWVKFPFSDWKQKAAISSSDWYFFTLGNILNLFFSIFSWHDVFVSLQASQYVYFYRLEASKDNVRWYYKRVFYWQEYFTLDLLMVTASNYVYRVPTKLFSLSSLYWCSLKPATNDAGLSSQVFHV